MSATGQGADEGWRLYECSEELGAGPAYTGNLLRVVKTKATLFEELLSLLFCCSHLSTSTTASEKCTTVKPQQQLNICNGENETLFRTERERRSVAGILCPIPQNMQSKI